MLGGEMVFSIHSCQNLMRKIKYVDLIENGNCTSRYLRIYIRSNVMFLMFNSFLVHLYFVKLKDLKNRFGSKKNGSFLFGECLILDLKITFYSSGKKRYNIYCII